jgi:prevent-host-death family protein
MFTMKIINIQEVKTHLSRYIDEVARGAELIIGKAGKPLAKLVPYHPMGKPRMGGQLKGKVREAQDCWGAGDDQDLVFASRDA